MARLGITKRKEGRKKERRRVIFVIEEGKKKKKAGPLRNARKNVDPLWNETKKSIQYPGKENCPVQYPRTNTKKESQTWMLAVKNAVEIFTEHVYSVHVYTYV